MRQFLTRKLVLVAPRRRLLPAALPVAETGNLALAAGDVADGHVRRLHARDAGKDQEKPAPPKWVAGSVLWGNARGIIVPPDRDASVMALALNNAQGELSPLEIRSSGGMVAGSVVQQHVAQHPVRLRLSGRGRLLVDDGMLGEAGDFPLRMIGRRGLRDEPGDDERGKSDRNDSKQRFRCVHDRSKPYPRSVEHRRPEASAQFGRYSGTLRLRRRRKPVQFLATNKSQTLAAVGCCLALVKLRCFAVSEIDSRRSA